MGKNQSLNRSVRAHCTTLQIASDSSHL